MLGAYAASGRLPLVTSSLDEAPAMRKVEVKKDGTFSVELPPGAYVFRAFSAVFDGAIEVSVSGGLGAVSREGVDSGWMLGAVGVNGRDVTDEPVQIADRDISGISIRLTKRAARLEGRVRRADGGNPGDAAVVLFPTSRQQWQDYGDTEWRVRCTRVTPEGDYGFANLPPGEYYIVAVGDDPPADSLSVTRLEQLTRTATTITLTPGQTRTQALEFRGGGR
jgi:hypothetical protein